MQTVHSACLRTISTFSEALLLLLLLLLFRVISSFARPPQLFQADRNVCRKNKKVCVVRITSVYCLLIV